MLDERKALLNEVAQLRRDLALAGGGGGAQHETKPETINGIDFVVQTLTGVSGKDLPALVDSHKEKIGSGVILLIADTGGKAAIAAGVTPDLIDRISAVDIVRKAAVALGGRGGGGRPDMAQAGGASAEKADQAIAAVKQMLEE